jgi:hypothetical protein
LTDVIIILFNKKHNLNLGAHCSLVIKIKKVPGETMNDVMADLASDALNSLAVFYLPHIDV